MGSTGTITALIAVAENGDGFLLEFSANEESTDGKCSDFDCMREEVSNTSHHIDDLGFPCPSDPGVYICKARLVFSRDYYGEVDSEFCEVEPPQLVFKTDMLSTGKGDRGPHGTE